MSANIFHVGKENFHSCNSSNKKTITLYRLEWPVRTLSFSHDGSMLASGSEDLLIDVSHVATGERIIGIPVDTPTFTVAWHPRIHLLAFACDDKDDSNNRDAGTVKLFGILNE